MGETKKKWAIGLGTTDECNLNCPHCYSRTAKHTTMSFEEFKEFIDSVDATSLNFGTGENGLNPDFEKILDYVYEKNISHSLTSNGYTILKLSEERLKRMNDLDVSLEFPYEEKQTEFRGPDSWKYAMAALDYCKQLNITTSIAMCLMNINYKYIAGFKELMKKYNVYLRVNIYKPVNTDKYKLTYEEFWQAIKLIFAEFKVVSCSEPVINAVLGRKHVTDSVCGCGSTSLRITPYKKIVPCVYWKDSPYGLEDFDNIDENSFPEMRIVPEECKNCEYVEMCQGGCAGRRKYTGIDKPDEYCPFIRNDKIEIENTVEKIDKDFVHASYLCTFILDVK